MPDINGIPYVESTDLVSAYPAASQALAQEISDQLASKLPYSYGTATPSTTDSGFLWYDSNSTPPVPKYWNGSSFATLAPAAGLELITTETLSAVSTVSLNGCFTADYENYRIQLNVTASAEPELRLRMRASGTDNSASNSYRFNFFQYTSVPGTAGIAGTNTYAGIADGDETYPTQGFLDMYSPQASTATTAVGMFQQMKTNAFVSMGGFTHTVASAFDGFTIFPSTGTISGTIRVYGYED